MNTPKTVKITMPAPEVKHDSSKKEDDKIELDNAAILQASGNLGDQLKTLFVTKEFSQSYLNQRLELLKRAPMAARDEFFTDFPDQSKDAFKDLFLGVPIPSPERRSNMQFFDIERSPVNPPQRAREAQKPVENEDIFKLEL